MFGGKEVVVVMPACNAEKTLRRTWEERPHALVDEVVLVDDASGDYTVQVAQELGIQAVRHPENMGYGANQKTGCKEALRRGGDIVVIIHPDYQYSPRLVAATASRGDAAIQVEANSDDFVFDNEILAQAVYLGFRTG